MSVPVWLTCWRSLFYSCISLIDLCRKMKIKVEWDLGAFRRMTKLPEQRNPTAVISVQRLFPPRSSSETTNCSTLKLNRSAVTSRGTARLFQSWNGSKDDNTATLRKDDTPVRNVSHLKSHRLIHSPIKHCRCEQCGMAFTYKQHLIKHQLTHTGDKPHRCDLCWKAFSQISSLKVHQRSHTRERPFKWGQCGQTFRALGQTTPTDPQQEAASAVPSPVKYEDSNIWIWISADTDTSLFLTSSIGTKLRSSNLRFHTFSHFCNKEFKENTKCCFTLNEKPQRAESKNTKFMKP